MSARFRSEGTCFLFARIGGKCTVHARWSASGGEVLDDCGCEVGSECEVGELDELDGLDRLDGLDGLDKFRESSELLDVLGVIVFVSTSCLDEYIPRGSSSKSKQKIVQTSSIIESSVGTNY